MRLSPCLLPVVVVSTRPNAFDTLKIGEPITTATGST
jgi:hypothetical protein